jgi:serine phosphatase RsbU (regulator of sigma subunit)
VTSAPASTGSAPAAAPASTPAAPPVSSDATTFQGYMDSIVHEWSKTLVALGITLIPLFFLLDVAMMPKHLLSRFGVYRLVTTLLIFIQYFVIYYTRPTKLSRAHGYFFSFVVGGMITLMTRDLGGFNSTYYAGLNLVIIAVNLLLPWEVRNSVVNSVLIIAMYVVVNAIHGKAFVASTLINNLYFLCSTAVIAVSINYVRQKLIRTEFSQRIELASARDALWSEMEVAKRIQTALLPDKKRVGGYEVAATMIPADEVGGDYYDVIVTAAGERWLAIGDVSGHGVESGLIMMMTQTSIFTTVNRTAGYKPSTVLNMVNSVIKENISRLGTDRYMTISAIQLDHHRLTFAGKHQDILIRRARRGITEFVPSKGTWIGILDDIGDYLTDTQVPIEDGDVILLYTDGVTEATNASGQMFGERNLERALTKYGHLPAQEIVHHIVQEVRGYMAVQRDDITVVALRRTDAAG